MAHADSSQARAHFSAGSRAYSLGEWTRAIDEYKKAYDASPDPAFLYNIGQAYRGAGDAKQALFFYRSYLRNAPDAPNRAEVEERIAKLQADVDRANRPPPTLTPAPAPTPPPPTEPASSATTLTAAAPPPRTPVYKKWWLWTGVGVVAVHCQHRHSLTRGEKILVVGGEAEPA